ncbi:MAG: hypothetical protein J7M32_03680 [Deltaproteobacteria bacterium]|nr:hypothetical protein [Deltaproteobacteria bacterium]OQX66300.1 MAG: hypothetical protein B5M55_00290 [Desulfococcus sp. 4484_242]
MTIETTKPHFARKHGPETPVDPRIEAALKQAAPAGKLACAVAFKIASDLNVEPKEVGRVADLLEMRMVKCQLGLFGYQPEKRIVKPARIVPEDLEQAIKEMLIDGRLPCPGAWKISRDLGIRKMAVSSACETLGIKISSCQLGAF